MSKKFSNFKRFMTMFLIVVMLVGMLPTTALAGYDSPPATSPGVGGETGGLTKGPQPPDPNAEPSSGYVDDKFDHDQARFTRYTLVRFDFSDETPDTIPASTWANKGKVIGSVDVMTDRSVPAGTIYFTTDSGLLSNAFSSRMKNGSSSSPFLH